MEELSAAIRKHLGPGIPVCGCTGSAVVGTGKDRRPSHPTRRLLGSPRAPLAIRIHIFCAELQD